MNIIRKFLIAAVAVCATLSVTAGTAHADGTSWSTNPTLCQSGCSMDANYIRFWQSVLWADNVYGRITSTTFIDGQFGPNTNARTKDWQSIHLDWDGKPLLVDGRTGPRTWWSAQYTYNKNVCSFDQEGNKSCTFYGTAHQFKWGVPNAASNNWWFINPRTGTKVWLTA
ncbi:peptidoglycan-binding protein [Streptomyces sp. NPDC016562]|uniref:peptidoglycan-binding domain-containing protein n=1 Tax=Streptomyces sp. NPDC016562 TaxID=3364966 RepID=UPI0036F88DD4